EGCSHVVVSVRIRQNTVIGDDATNATRLELADENRADPGQVVLVELSPAPVDRGLWQLEPVSVGAERDPVVSIRDLLQINEELEGPEPSTLASQTEPVGGVVSSRAEQPCPQRLGDPPAEFARERLEGDRHGGKLLLSPSLLGKREPAHDDAGRCPVDVVQTAPPDQSRVSRDEATGAASGLVHAA